MLFGLFSMFNRLFLHEGTCVALAIVFTQGNFVAIGNM